MLYVVNTRNESFGLHVGEVLCLPYKISEIIEIQADGDELDRILREFDGIPKHRTAPVQRWTGEFARYILRNMGY